MTIHDEDPVTVTQEGSEVLFTAKHAENGTVWRLRLRPKEAAGLAFDLQRAANAAADHIVGKEA
jgi:hypothetical protein